MTTGDRSTKHLKNWAVETEREKTYYRFLAKRDISWRNLTKYYGETRTSLGCGSVFELVRDKCGRVSKTLQHYLTEAQGDEFDIDGLTGAVRQLHRYMLDEKVITMTLEAKNICYQNPKNSGGKLVIVDGVGHADYIPVCHHINYLAVKKIQRHWSRFEGSILKTCEHNPRLNEAFHRTFVEPAHRYPG